MCLIFKRKGWDGGFISENIEFEFQKSELTLYLLFFSYCFLLCFIFFFILFFFFLFVSLQSFFFFLFFFNKQPLSGFLKNRCSCISEMYKYNPRSRWCAWKILVWGVGGSVWVELQAYNLLLDLEMSPFGGIFSNFAWILWAFFIFFQKSSWVATIIAFVVVVVVVAVVSFCLFCFVLFLLLFLLFSCKYYKTIVLLCLLMKKKNLLN